MYAIDANDALIVVDVQNDFLPGGTLAVAEGRRIFDPINRSMPLFSYVVATRDWHPKVHPHFQKYGGTWPFHCLQNTPGAEFAAELDRSHIDVIVSKGMHPPSHGYDAFDGTALAKMLQERGIQRVFVCGLATDYCVKATALQAQQNGFRTIVLADSIAAVNLNPADEAAAIAEMKSHGVEFAASLELRNAA